MVGGVCFLLLVSLTLSSMVHLFSHQLEHSLPGGKTLPLLINLALDLVVVTALFALIFKYLPDAKIAWRDVWIGAGLTTLLFLVGKWALSLYLGGGSAGSAYGAARRADHHPRVGLLFFADSPFRGGVHADLRHGIRFARRTEGARGTRGNKEDRGRAAGLRRIVTQGRDGSPSRPKLSALGRTRVSSGTSFPEKVWDGSESRPYLGTTDGVPPPARKNRQDRGSHQLFLHEEAFVRPGIIVENTEYLVTKAPRRNYVLGNPKLRGARDGTPDPAPRPRPAASVPSQSFDDAVPRRPRASRYRASRDGF